ncbi:MAG: hypothetical protein ACRDNW_22410 [Trebonia sp.]
MADDLLGGARSIAALRVREIGRNLDYRDQDLPEEPLVIGTTVTLGKPKP